MQYTLFRGFLHNRSFSLSLFLSFYIVYSSPYTSLQCYLLNFTQYLISHPAFPPVQLFIFAFHSVCLQYACQVFLNPLLKSHIQLIFFIFISTMFHPRPFNHFRSQQLESFPTLFNVQVYVCVCVFVCVCVGFCLKCL